jgi:hypothetical protein
VLALLALACFPVLAHATDSGEAQYTDAPPTVTGKKPPKSQGPPANKSTAQNGGQPAQQPKGGSNEGNHTQAESRQGGSPGGSGGGTGGGGGGTGGSKGGGGNGSGHSSNPSPPGGGTTKPVPTGSDSGSSPLVPILIAIAALAAISIGAVMFRQRRRRGTPSAPVSPKAG